MISEKWQLFVYGAAYGQHACLKSMFIRLVYHDVIFFFSVKYLTITEHNHFNLFFCHFVCQRLHVFQICNFLVGLYFLELVDKFGVGPVYGAFGAVSLMSAIFAAYFIVETKGRSLEEIEMSMNARLPTKDKWSNLVFPYPLTEPACGLPESKTCSFVRI